MDQFTFDRMMGLPYSPEGHKSIYYSAFKNKVDQLKHDHMYDANRLVGELKLVLDVFSNILLTDQHLSTTSMDIVPQIDQLKMVTTNAMNAYPNVTEEMMDHVNTGLMNVEPMLSYNMFSEMDMNTGRNAFMPFLNKDINSTTFDMLANDINNVYMTLNTAVENPNPMPMPFDAHMMTNLDIYHMSSDYVEIAGLFENAWGMTHMPYMPPMPE